MSKEVSSKTRCGRQTSRPHIYKDAVDDDFLIDKENDEDEDEDDQEVVVIDKNRQSNKRKHSDKVVKMEIGDSKTEVYCCQKCPAKFPSQSSYYYHMNQHGAAKPKKHVCTYCDYSTAYEKNMLAHIDLHLQFEKGSACVVGRPVAKASRRIVKVKSFESDCSTATTSSGSSRSTKSRSRSRSPVFIPPPPKAQAQAPPKAVAKVVVKPAAKVAPKAVLKAAPKAASKPTKAPKAEVKFKPKSNSQTPVSPEPILLEESENAWLLKMDAPKKKSLPPALMSWSQREAYYMKQLIKRREETRPRKRLVEPETLEEFREQELLNKVLARRKKRAEKRKKEDKLKRSTMSHGHMAVFNVHHAMRSFHTVVPAGPLMTSARVKAMNGVCRFKCPKEKCLFKAAWERELAEHLDCHGWDAEFKCDQCDYMNNSEKDVQFHRVNHHAVVSKDC